MGEMIEKFNQAYKDAMKSKDMATVQCIRQVKAKVQEITNAKGFSGEIDDGVYQKAIGSYVKSLKKAIAEIGDSGQALVADYQKEIDYLNPYLPQTLNEEATTDLLKKAIAELGVSEPKDVGRVMGAVMKTHKGQVDAALVKRLATILLGG